MNRGGCVFGIGRWERCFVLSLLMKVPPAWESRQSLQALGAMMLEIDRMQNP